MTQEIPILRVGCWYHGKIKGYGNRGDPTIFHGMGHPKVILKGCESMPAIGTDVIYEITNIPCDGNFLAFAKYKEDYVPNPSALLSKKSQ